MRRKDRRAVQLALDFASTPINSPVIVWVGDCYQYAQRGTKAWGFARGMWSDLWFWWLHLPSNCYVRVADMSMSQINSYRWGEHNKRDIFYIGNPTDSAQCNWLTFDIMSRAVRVLSRRSYRKWHSIAVRATCSYWANRIREQAPLHALPEPWNPGQGALSYTPDNGLPERFWESDIMACLRKLIEHVRSR